MRTGNKPSRTRRWAISLAAWGILTIGPWLLVSRLAGCIGFLVGIHAIAWRHDNQTGTWFPVTMLLTVSLLILVGLVYLMAVIHR